MNLLIVNIGSTCIAKEPLSLFNGGRNTSTIPQYQPLTAKPAMKSSLIVKPKFSQNATKGAPQQDMLVKLRSKTDILSKIINMYFGGDSNTTETFEYQLITEIQADIMKQKRNDDFASFQRMISILAQETKDDYSFYATMTKAQYEALTQYQRCFLMNSISKVKYQIAMDHLLLFEPSPSAQAQLQVPQPNSTANKLNKSFFDIQSEKNDLFRKYVNNPDLPEDQIKTYVSVCNGDILKGVDIYFQAIFNISMLTLRYIYDNNEEVIHYFSFNNEVIELKKGVEEDRPMMKDFSLLTFDKKEIDIQSNPKRLIGTFEFINNSAILVLEKKSDVLLSAI